MKKLLIAAILCILAVAAAGQVEIENIYGIYWDDLRFPASVQTFPAGAANITEDSVSVGLTFETDAVMVTDWTFFPAQMSHGYRLGTNLFPHIHWEQAEDNIPNWLIQYRCYDIGEATQGSWVDSPQVSSFITYTSGSIHQLTSFADFNPNFSGVSGMCDFKLYRDTDNTSTEFAGADPYTLDVLMKEFDIHFQSDVPGSISVSSKW